MTPKSETLSETISACISNGKRLLDDAKFLLDWDRYSTALALSVLAQEEFAKAFLLQLVADKAIPWISEVQRSMARHQCKHLLAIVMEWLPTFDYDKIIEQIRREKQEVARLQRKSERYKQGNFLPDPNDPEPIKPNVVFPPDVADALNIYRHEEVERLGSRSPSKDTDLGTGKARKIADGLLDRKKQSAFYVDITKTGEIGLHPELITREEASDEIERAERLSEDTNRSSDEYKRLKEILPHLFSNLKE